MKTAILFSALFLLSICGFSQQTVKDTIIMRNISAKTMWDGHVMNVYGFGPDIGTVPVPGPTLICNEGDTLNIFTLNISQGSGHTIHPHGMDVPQNMDGVHETSFEITHMMDTNLIWVATQAGTYIYHCHMASVLHVQMGMYGSIIVRAAGGAKTAWTGGPAFDKDCLWLMSEMDSYWHDSLPGSAFWEDDFQVPPYNPGYFLINGLSKAQLNDASVAISAKVGEKVYLRLSNIGYYMNEVILPSSLSPVILVSDGRPLPVSIPGDTIRLVPGERYEVMLTPSQEFPFTAQVRYLDMNNLEVHEVEYVPITISGVIGREESFSEKRGIKVWPNPASESVKIDVGNFPTNEAIVEIRDISGILIQSTPFPMAATREFMIDLSGIPSGIYSIGIRSRSFAEFRKLIIQ